MPDLFFYKLEGIISHKVIIPLAGFNLNGYKRFLYGQNMDANVLCRMNLSRFPHDSQVCIVKLGSYTYNDEALVVKFMKKVENSEIKVPHPNGYTINIIYKQGETTEWPPSGNFTTSDMQVTIKRHISTYVFTYYAPTGLFVVISWAVFVMSADKLQFR